MGINWAFPHTHGGVMVNTVDIGHDVDPGRNLEVPLSEGSIDVPQGPSDRGVKAHSFLNALCEVLKPYVLMYLTFNNYLLNADINSIYL